MPLSMFVADNQKGQCAIADLATRPSPPLALSERLRRVQDGLPILWSVSKNHVRQVRRMRLWFGPGC